MQYAMFRQTIMRGAIKRGILAGATNCTDDKNKVIATFEGDEQKIKDLVSVLTSGKELNSWHAVVGSFEKVDEGLPIEQHEVRVDNVDSIKWPGEVEIYI